MDTAAIFAIIDKGLTLLPYLITAGQDVVTLIENLKTLNTAVSTGTEVPADQVTAIEAEIDQGLSDFNADI